MKKIRMVHTKVSKPVFNSGLVSARSIGVGGNMLWACVLLIAATASTGFCAGYTDINLQVTPEPKVRFTTGKTICTETLKDGRWIGLHWTPDGRIDWPGPGFVHSKTQAHGNTEPAFDLEIDGQSLTSGWTFIAAAEVAKTDKGSRHYVVELVNTIRPVKLKIHTLLDGTPVIVRWLEITNTSDKPASLSHVSPWAGRMWSVAGHKEMLPSGTEIFSLGYFTSRYWGWEGWFNWLPLKGVTTRIDGMMGAGGDDPFFVVKNKALGQYFFGSLEWSANFHMEFLCEQEPASEDPVLLIHHRSEPNLNFKIGPSATAPQRVIAAGETISTPRMHLGHLEGDFDSVVHAMHDHVRRSVLPADPPGREMLFEYDNGAACFGYLEGRYNEEQMFKDIDLAISLEAEVYIMDAGWYDFAGDWVPSSSRFPNGLKPLSDYVHKNNMLFGLYMEPEKADPGSSKFGQEHLDWFIPGSAILDLTKPEVAVWVESEISRVITEYEVDLFRLDFNPGYPRAGKSTPRGEFSENDYWRYYETFYSMIDRLRAKFPNVLFQQASEGGKRNDLGVAGRFHETYLTDGLMTPRVLKSYCGQALALPPEIFVIGLGIAIPFDYIGHLDTHLRATFTLSRPFILSGVAPPHEVISPERKERYLHFINIYKNFIRPIFATCKVYNHAPITAYDGVDSDGWLVIEFGAENREKGWATFIRLGESDSDIFLFKPKGLNPGKSYRVTFDNMDETATIDGVRLMQEGLPIRLESIMSSELLLFEAI